MPIRESRLRLYNNATARPLTSTELAAKLAVSSTDTYYSAPIALGNASLLGVQAIWTGTPTGTLTVEFSNDPGVGAYWDAYVAQAAVGVAPTWTAPTTGGTFPANPAGGASSVLESFGNIGYMWARVKYVNASGSGTLDICVSSKDY
jgi:hypothetical protein